MERAFSISAQAKIEIMIQTMKEEMRLMFEEADWMDIDTKSAAIFKLQKMNFKIGNPYAHSLHTNIQKP